MRKPVKIVFKIFEIGKRKEFIVFLAAVLFLLVYFKQRTRSTDKILSSTAQKVSKLIVWATPLVENYETTRFCGTKICTFSSNPGRFHEAEAVLFYASDIKLAELPLPRLSKQIWALLHEESPRNVPYLLYETVLKYFNFTSTFSRYSDLPLTTQHLANLSTLTSPHYLVPIGEKTRLRRKDGLAAIAFLQSNCDTMSGRDEYVKELMQHIDVDSYGKCLNNRKLPNSLKDNYIQNLDSKELFHFLARYKFVIAFENGICEDYITEKFWRPLIIGSIPIYFGSPSMKDWQPNEKSIISIADFPNPKSLAEFVKILDADDVAYNTYLNHKYNLKEPVSNRRLLNELQKRIANGNDNFFGCFECFICEQIHKSAELNSFSKQASLKHYECPLPPIYPPMNKSVTNDWESLLFTAKYQAIAIDYYLEKNLKFTQSEFEQKIDFLFNKDLPNL